MKQVFYLVAVCTFVLSACTGSFKKGDNGLEYKIIKDGSGKTIGYGNIMQIHIKQVYSGTKDTVLLDSRDYMPRIQLLDSVATPLSYYKILSQLRKGDSLVLRILTDTAFKNIKQEMPPFMKKGKYLYTYVKLVNFFETKEQADSAYDAEAKIAKPVLYKKQLEEIEKGLSEKKAQLEAEGKVIEAYLAKNNIKATKTKWGTYVAITSEGTGEKITKEDVASVNYTGRTLDSNKVFDSNIDPKFGHQQPLDVNMGQLGSVILGWTDALMQLKKGAKATVFVPSILGYGPSGNGEVIKPNSHLIFDMEVLDVATEAAFEAKQKNMQEEMMRKMQELQKQPADSSKKPGN